MMILFSIQIKIGEERIYTRSIPRSYHEMSIYNRYVRPWIYTRQMGAAHHYRRHGEVVEGIDGLIRVHKDGHVERFPIVHDVPCMWSLNSAVDSTDVRIDTQLWARIYVPKALSGKLPVLVYFHGGGFCVASAAWSCYHEFLSRLALKARCIIVSVNYRLAPEHRLPAAYDDGFTIVKWLRKQVGGRSWWFQHCDLFRFFLGGDSAGGTIAYNVVRSNVNIFET